MQKGTSIDDIHLPLQILQQTLLVKDIHRRQNLTLQLILIIEQLVSALHKTRSKLGTIDVFLWSTIVDQLTYVLAETTSEIEVDLILVLESVEYFGVGGHFGEIEVEEAPAADAGVGPNFPGFFALRRKLVLGTRKGAP
jgi:hypothetical protein